MGYVNPLRQGVITLRNQFQQRCYVNSYRLFSSTANRNADIDVTFENGVRTLTLNRPSKLNSITDDMYKVIVSNLNESNTDDNTKLIVLTGTGDFYTSGTDIQRFANVKDPKALAEFAKAMFTEYVSSFINARKPIVALVNGHAVGIGVTTLGLVDTVYASDKATFSTPFSSLGLVPEGCSSYTFPRIMGYAKANDMLRFDRRLNAEEALQFGLVSRVIPHDKFRDETAKLIKKITKLPLKSLVYSKELVQGRERELLHRVNLTENERLLERWQSEDFFKSIAQFFTKPAK